jgi:hypothetical protein
MTVYPKILYNCNLAILAGGGPDFRQLILEIWYDFNIDTGIQITEENIQMACHKDAISVTYTENYVELCINGTKFLSLTNEYFVLDGETLVPLNCVNLGFSLINAI